MFLRSEANFYPWQPLALLRVAGSDALTFLQGQFTNDLRKPMASGAVYGLWLNQKGKVVADSFVLPAKEPETFWVCSYFSPASVIRERLEAFIIADDVVVKDVTAEWAAVTVFGAVDETALREAMPESLVFQGRRDRGTHREWVFPKSFHPQVMALFTGGHELTEAEVTRRRIEAGIPAVPADIGLGELPNEGGLDTEAISYTKGCYLGQEVMARLKSMGKVRRRLLRVRGRGADLPALPAGLFQGERRMGELRSAIITPEGFAGLALVTLMNLQATEGLSLAAGAPATIAVLDQP